MHSAGDASTPQVATAPVTAAATAVAIKFEPTPAPPVSSSDASVNFTDLLARCDGDSAMMCRLIQIFQNKSRQTWDGLLASYQSGDAAGTARLAHALKGRAANLSAIKVSSLAATIRRTGTFGGFERRRVVRPRNWAPNWSVVEKALFDSIRRPVALRVFATASKPGRSAKTVNFLETFNARACCRRR